MLSLRNINPMVRAIGTMGAVAALVGGITFAQLPGNTVTLANNTLTSANTTLEIGLTSTCTDASLGPVQGMQFNNLLPTVPSSPFTFCLDNLGNTPLALTANIPGSFSGSAIAAKDVSLIFNCGIGGASTGTVVNLTYTVKQLNDNSQVFDANLNDDTNNVLGCTVTATLDSSVTKSNTSMTPFDINFVSSSIAPTT